MRATPLPRIRSRCAALPALRSRQRRIRWRTRSAWSERRSRSCCCSREAIEAAKLGEARFARLLRLAEAGEVPAFVGGADEQGQGECGRPERTNMEQVAAAAEAGKERLAGPERRQHRRNRRLQRGKE